ncbi:MAG: molybdopterin-dependent oxidoreductase [Clostridiaceae bacterium]|jgi:CO/xanthine dehydrogenase Mo-binding subunit|nr:molybdopterin-dependent oxidoreductase [Clostridiaceae bacterium]
MEEYKVVGKSCSRRDALSLVMGCAKFTDDLNLPGMVYGKILRSPHAHARVASIDKTEAEKVDGVLGILLPEDVPDVLFNCGSSPPYPAYVKDERILTAKPLYAGDRIAAVAALTPKACEEALAKMAVRYEVLPAVFDVRDAMKEDAPLIHPELFKSNVFKKTEMKQGDVERGFQESDYIFEDEFHIPSVQHVAMEPVSCICDYSREGKLTVWANSQVLFHDRRILAEILNMRENDVRIIKPFMGGGFGQRQQLHNQPVGALLSKLVGRPVKIINTREEEMYASCVRMSCICRLKFGVSQDGRILAYHVKVYGNSGAYCTHTPIVLGSMSKKYQYHAPHYHFEAFSVYTNAPVAGAMRGYGNPQLTLCREIMMDKMARKLGIDPIKFRLMNHVEVGENFPGVPFTVRSCAIRECVKRGEEIRQEIDHKEVFLPKDSNTVESWGVAFGCHASGTTDNEGMSSSAVLVHDDGTMTLLTGTSDMGQGSETAFSQILAEEMGVELKDISVTAADTSCTPYEQGSFASSQAYVGGNAVYNAAVDAKDKICSVLAKYYGIEPEKISHKKGVFTVKAPEGDIFLSLKECMAKIAFGKEGTAIIGSACYKADRSPAPFHVCWAKVAVDNTSGVITLRHFIQVADVGTAINPDIVKGQLHGGTAQGIGLALMEQIEIDKTANKPSTSDLLHYKVPTSLDMPEIHVDIVKNSYEPTGPFGAKSVGELSTVAVAPAIVNAVSNATGENSNFPTPLAKVFLLGGNREDFFY